MKILGGIIGRILGSKEVVKAGISGIDKMFYTNEEKADQKTKLLAAFEPFKLALRLLALTIAIPYVLMAMAAFTASFWVDVTDQLAILDGKLGWAFTIVVAFYFADGIGILKGLDRKEKRKARSAAKEK